MINRFIFSSPFFLNYNTPAGVFQYVYKKKFSSLDTNLFCLVLLKRALIYNEKRFYSRARAKLLAKKIKM